MLYHPSNALLVDERNHDGNFSREKLGNLRVAEKNFHFNGTLLVRSQIFEVENTFRHGEGYVGRHEQLNLLEIDRRVELQM